MAHRLGMRYGRIQNQVCVKLPNLDWRVVRVSNNGLEDIWLQRDDNKKPYWIPHEIDTNSGIGLQVIIEDMNNDLKPDILIGNKKGVFYFENSL